MLSEAICCGYTKKYARVNPIFPMSALLMRQEMRLKMGAKLLWNCRFYE